MVNVRIEGSAETVVVNEREALLTALIKAGVSAIPSGCRSGGCGICKVQIISGQYDAGQMSSAHIDAEALSTGFALACKVYPTSDMHVKIHNTRVRRMAFGK